MEMDLGWLVIIYKINYLYWNLWFWKAKSFTKSWIIEDYDRSTDVAPLSDTLLMWKCYPLYKNMFSFLQINVDGVKWTGLF